MSEGAVRSNVRRALQAGATPRRDRHVVAPTVTTRGFPAACWAVPGSRRCLPLTAPVTADTEAAASVVVRAANPDALCGQPSARRDSPPAKTAVGADADGARCQGRGRSTETETQRLLR